LSANNPKKFAECHEKLLFAVLPLLKTGKAIPELEIQQSLVPLVLKDYRFEGMLTGRLEDFTVGSILEFFSPGNAKIK
jgi:hypothetical protein